MQQKLRKETTMAKKDTDTIHPEFTLLITGSENNDLAAERITSGSVHLVYHKLAYAAPFMKYEELRKIQLKIRQSPYSVGKKICVAVDISDWIGHEEEEYFVASVKFFHDHCDRMGFVFTVGESDITKIQKMYLKLRMYMRGVVKADETFLKVDALTSYIMSCSAESDAAALLAKVLMSGPMKPLRTYPAVKNICSDIADISGHSRITLKDVIHHLNSENSLIYLINKDVSLRYAKEAEKTIGRTGSHSAA